MRILRHDQPAFQRFWKESDRRHEPAGKVSVTVTEIIDSVRAGGDRAVIELNARYGGPRVRRAAALRVAPEEVQRAGKNVPRKVRAAMKETRRNVHDFAKCSLRRSWKMRNRQGATVGERHDPFERVGIYVPGGTAPLVSTALMTATLARAAGVPQIVAATPAGGDGEVAPAMLCALSIAGANEIYKIGGAQAVAALGLGTRTIRRVDKIFGPGNAYVVEAKRQLFGTVGIDLLPGPSEIMVIADDSARPEWIAADLLAQAEHGHGSLALLLSPEERLVEETLDALQKQFGQLERQTHLQESLKENTLLALTRDLEQAVEIANRFAPEHLAIATRRPARLARKIKTAGAVFLGHYSPVAGGDFLAGPSHELPTGGAGHGFSGLTADQFQRRTSIIQFTRKALEKSAPLIESFCEVEGLDAHARSVTRRLTPDAEGA